VPRTKEEILIVDDTATILTSMSLVLSEIGYRVRTAEDGFAALRQIGQIVPDILVSDLNMPGMSGFELLTVIRQRFPAIQTIAMSGAFSGKEVPAGVAADSFFQKGSSIGALLQIIEGLAQVERRIAHSRSTVTPLTFHQSGHDSSPALCASISCPECLRTFSKPLDDTAGQAIETHCIHCDSILSGFVQQLEPHTMQALQYETGASLNSYRAGSLSL
jgi:CheY-like chemotaxis protein